MDEMEGAGPLRDSSITSEVKKVQLSGCRSDFIRSSHMNRSDIILESKGSS